MKKRLTAALLSLSVAVSLGACGGKSADQPGGTSKEQSGTADIGAQTGEPYVPTYPIVEEPITVTGLVVGCDTSVSESRDVWDKAEEITGIHIDWINIDEAALSTYLAGSDWPDFFHTYQLSTSQINDYGVVGGRFVNYLDYLNIMPNLAKAYEDYPAALAASTQINGEVYNLFQINGDTSTGTTARPHVRMDVLENAGITEYPKTVDDLNGSWDNLGCLAPLTSEYDSEQSLAGRIDYRPVAGMFINKDSQYVEELCKLFDIAYATEEIVEGSGLYGQTFTYGFENVDWILNDDNTYEQIVPEGFESFTAYQNQKLRWWDLGRADKFGQAITSTVGNAQARQKGYVSNVIPYMATDHIFPTGLLKFTDDEQYVIDNRYADISLYITEMEAKFITGVADIESEWDAYVAECERMGLSEVLKVYQSAYDRWNQALAALES